MHSVRFCLVFYSFAVMRNVYYLSFFLLLFRGACVRGCDLSSRRSLLLLSSGCGRRACILLAGIASATDDHWSEVVESTRLVVLLDLLNACRRQD